ncbi:Phosphohydrolase [Pandoravirus salinus]|uniref:Phosphohydrolase n=1 Tax=Pandoravirus salinus TaxID=1349410 RepID=S4W0L5_9VIRU|nr:Histidine decarboxylase domain [Pandoravirus salinus]AGO83635.1 Phosphohydrolase [Pandoravirus salinus]
MSNAAPVMTYGTWAAEESDRDPTVRPIVACAISLARGIMGHFGAAHDMSHVDRVVANARSLVSGLVVDSSPTTAIDTELVVLGCILHDVANPLYATMTFTTPEAIVSLCAQYLVDRGHLVDEPERLAKLKRIMRHASYVDPAEHAATESEQPTFVELDLVRDADRLDGLGPVGVARACMIGAYHGWTLVGPHTPTVAEWIATGRPVLPVDGTVAAYLYGRVLSGPTSTLATLQARALAAPLVAYVESYLDALVAQNRRCA